MTAASGPERRRHLRPSVPDDDLLAGFGREGRPQWLRVFFASTIGASLVVWEVAFDLGAYHTVFYSRLFQILVVSTVLLAGSLILRHQVRVRLWMRFVLAVPLLWLLERSVAPLGHTSTAAKVLDDVMVGLVVASLPFTIWALVRILAPDFFDLHNRRLQVISVVIVVLIAVAGFLVGQFNYRFTTCHDYIVAGDNTPSNCRNQPSGGPP